MASSSGLAQGEAAATGFGKKWIFMLKKKLLLISPRGSLMMANRSFSRFVKSSVPMSTYMRFWSGMSTALLILAALAEKKYDVRVVDENFSKVPYDEPWDLVGLTAVTQQANRAYQIARRFRDRNIPVAMGGVHASVMLEEAGKHVDFVFVGEAEETWKAFLKDFEKGRPQKIYRAQDYPDVSLTSSPLPRYDLINPETYKIVWVQTSRGCPHDCEFCAASRIYGRRYRRKHVSQVVEEIQYIHRHWKDAYIGFADDNMFVDRKYVLSLLEKIGRLNIRWFAQSDISVGADRSYLHHLHQGGCKFLFIGLESLSKKNLLGLNTNQWKMKTLPFYQSYVRNIQAEGIGVFGSFIVGFDHDTVSTFERIQKFILRNKLFGAQISLLTPFPGSRLYTRLVAEKKITCRNWDQYTGWNAVIRPDHLDQNQMESGIIRIYEEIYSQENRVKMLKHFKSLMKGRV